MSRACLIAALDEELSDLSISEDIITESEFSTSLTSPKEPLQGVVNMGPTLPPQSKGCLPQYAHDRLVELQEKFDHLENAGVFKRPEDVGIIAEYVNPSFL